MNLSALRQTNANLSDKVADDKAARASRNVTWMNYCFKWQYPLQMCHRVVDFLVIMFQVANNRCRPRNSGLPRHSRAWRLHCRRHHSPPPPPEIRCQYLAAAALVLLPTPTTHTRRHHRVPMPNRIVRIWNPQREYWWESERLSGTPVRSRVFDYFFVVYQPSAVTATNRHTPPPTESQWMPWTKIRSDLSNCQSRVSNNRIEISCLAVRTQSATKRGFGRFACGSNTLRIERIAMAAVVVVTDSSSLVVSLINRQRYGWIGKPTPPISHQNCSRHFSLSLYRTSTGRQVGSDKYGDKAREQLR